MPGLKTFSDYVTDVKSLSSVTAKGAAAAPLVDYAVKIGPPWPPHVIPLLTTIIELICLACIFQFWRVKPVSKLSRNLIILVIMFCISTFVYLGLSSSFTFRHPKTGELMVKGFTLLPEVEQVMSPDYGPEEALKGNQYDPEGVWTNFSVTATRLILVALWVLMFVSLSSFLGMFVVIQQIGPIIPISERSDRYPAVESNEVKPSDPVKKAKLKKQKERYDEDASFFTHPRPQYEEIALLPESQFDFPALPITKSDVIVIGKVLNAEAHRSENKRNVFSNFEVRVDEVLKGSNLTSGSVINIQRIGGAVKYPDGRKVLFRLIANGMPAVEARCALFLNVIDEEDYRILTGYELGPEGVMPLDYSRQFQAYQGQNETDFLKALRDAVSQTVPQQSHLTTSPARLM